MVGTNFHFKWPEVPTQWYSVQLVFPRPGVRAIAPLLERDTVTEKSLDSVVQLETIYLNSKLHMITKHIRLSNDGINLIINYSVLNETK
jgi:hypothetical protein